jgi:hypothetical protein
VAQVATELALADVSLKEFLTSKYALWLVLKTTDDNQLHGSGRRVENASKGGYGADFQVAATAGALNVYLYSMFSCASIIMDAQLNIENGRFVSALY